MYKGDGGGSCLPWEWAVSRENSVQRILKLY